MKKAYGKDAFSRNLQVGIAKESNFSARQRPLVRVGKTMSLESTAIGSFRFPPLNHCLSNDFQNKSYFGKGIYLEKNPTKLISCSVMPFRSIHVVTNGGISYFLRLNNIPLYSTYVHIAKTWKQPKSPLTGECISCTL